MTVTLPPSTTDNTAPAILPIAQLDPSPLNPRDPVDDAAIADLVKSIRQLQLLQPLIIRPHPVNPGRFMIVDGHRRYHACLLAGLTHVPVHLLPASLSDADYLSMALAANLQRADLTPIEEARAYRQVLDAGVTQRDLGARIGRSQPVIANTLGLLDLPDAVQAHLQTGTLTASHGKALGSFKAFPAIVEHIAALAIQQKVPAKVLEAKLPFAHDLQSLRLVIDLTYERDIDRQTHCAACPYQAYRVQGGNHWCLKPEHATELRETVQRARQARLMAAETTRRAAPGREVAAAGGWPLTSLATRVDVVAAPEEPDAPASEETPAAVIDSTPSPRPPTPVLGIDVPWGAFQEIREYNPAPPGCSEACPCRVHALSAQGDPVLICIDPARWRGLADADGAARRQAKAEAYDAGSARLAAGEADQGAGWDRALAVLAAWVALHIGRRPALAESVGDLTDVPAVAKITWQTASVNDLRRAVIAFADVAPASLLRFAIESILRDELLDRRDGYAGTHSLNLATWWLGETTGDDPSAGKEGQVDA